MSECTQLESTEFARCFSLKAHGLLSYRTDGRVLIQRIGDPHFLPYRIKKQEIPIEQWIAATKARLARLPAWCREISELPSEEEIAEWISDSVVETPTGHAVEPDGVGPDGVPSWLCCLGLI